MTPTKEQQELIEAEATKRSLRQCTTGDQNLDKAISRYLKIGFEDGAHFGLSLAEKEIDRLNAIIVVSDSATGVMHQATRIKELERSVENLTPDDYLELATQLKSAHEEIGKLKAELWVEKDSRLRTYDGLTDKADKYDDMKAKLDKAITALGFYSNHDNWDHLPATSDPNCMSFVGIINEGDAGELARQTLKEIKGE